MIMLTSLQNELKRVIGEKPSYQLFYDTYLKIFRENHPNSGLPSNNMISMFYDDFMKLGEIIPY